jgi:hypothetical protein
MLQCILTKQQATPNQAPQHAFGEITVMRTVTGICTLCKSRITPNHDAATQAV